MELAAPTITTLKKGLHALAATALFATTPAWATDDAEEARNRAIVETSFARWRDATGSPFELLDPNATWTIVGSSPLAKRYASKQQFLEQVIAPFNARMATPLKPTIHALYTDGDTVVVRFAAQGRARDGMDYRNEYTWYLRMRDGRAVDVVAFFDNRRFDELFSRVPADG